LGIVKLSRTSFAFGTMEVVTTACAISEDEFGAVSADCLATDFAGLLAVAPAAFTLRATAGLAAVTVARVLGGVLGFVMDFSSSRYTMYTV